MFGAIVPDRADCLFGIFFVIGFINDVNRVISALYATIDPCRDFLGH